MWRLLDDDGRREVVRLNNQTIAGLPGPSPVYLPAIPDHFKEFHLRRFTAITEEPKPVHDMWFRYATIANVEAWGGFLASQLDPLLVRCEARLQTMSEGAAWFMGSTRKPGEVLWADADA